MGRRNDRQHLGPVLRLTDDLEAAVGFERPANAVEHEAVVVCNDYAHAKECRRAVSRRAGPAPIVRSVPSVGCSNADRARGDAETSSASLSRRDAVRRPARPRARDLPRRGIPPRQPRDRLRADVPARGAGDRRRPLPLSRVRLPAARRVCDRAADLPTGTEYRLRCAADRLRPGLAVVPRRARLAVLRRRLRLAAGSRPPSRRRTSRSCCCSEQRSAGTPATAHARPPSQVASPLRPRSSAGRSSSGSRRRDGSSLLSACASSPRW